MNTSARPTANNGAHFYLSDGTPFFSVPYADPSKGMRKATLADARKVGALPSVTTILRVLDKPALTTWLIEQAVLVAMTTPRLPNEADDAFIERVLHTEKQQEQEAQKARDLGTQIHDAIEDALNGEIIEPAMLVYVEPVLAALAEYGQVAITEKIIVGDGYAGRLDAAFGTALVDFKTTKKLPKQSYPEHRLQLAAYAQANKNLGIKTLNIYISTLEPGKIAVCDNGNWEHDYYNGFLPVLRTWQWLNDYKV